MDRDLLAGFQERLLQHFRSLLALFAVLEYINCSSNYPEKNGTITAMGQWMLGLQGTIQSLALLPFWHHPNSPDELQEQWLVS